MKKKLKYSKVCACITNAIGDYIPTQYVNVMFDDIEYTYHVKIKNAFGVAEYLFTWSQVITCGTNYVVESIKRDFIFPKECEE